MRLKFQGRRISGLAVVLPTRELSFVEEMRNFNFPEARSLKLKEVMGYDKRRVVEPGCCVSDLAVHGMEQLFAQGHLRREDVDALLVVTQTPDHLMPSTSSLIQGRLGLKRDMICLDLNLACAGFVIGLMQAFMWLEQESIKKVVLINGDVLSRKASPKDRNIYPLIGDAVSIAVIERDPSPAPILAHLQTDGSRAEVLIIPAGGMRLPASAETARLEDVGDNNLRAKDHVFMDGSSVFNFVQTEVPPMIERLLADAGTTASEVDYFLCHQPNRFMLQKLAEKMGVPYAKMPNNVVEHFGNTGSATIPMVISLNLRERLCREKIRAVLAGFGGGLAWAAMLLELGQFDFVTTIEYTHTS
jgi:3-oxoacyl-[acyl-carrier-protein] synthase-3